MEEGKKWEGTTLFRWKPDYFSAQKAYEEAAKLFRKGRNYTRYLVSKEALAIVLYNQGRLLKGASELETGALEAMSEVKDTKLPTKILEKAASWYREKGSIDRSSRTLVKAGKMMLEYDKKSAAKLLIKAVTAYPDRKEGDPVSSTDTYEACVAALVRNGLFDAADECVRFQLDAQWKSDSEYNHSIWKAWLTRAIIQLGKDDMKGACKIIEQGFKEVQGFKASAFGNVAQKFVDAAARENAEIFESLMKGEEFLVLSNEIGKLAKKIKFNPNWDVGAAKELSSKDVQPEAGVAGEECEELKTDDFDIR
uniref:Gamma-soluble NSF attachment protein n=1 Tax=Amorphochlora amoebiformis TaxID=1561963 RepID=A0A6T6WQ37_9EUKA